MKIIVTLAIEIDPEEWKTVYGLHFATRDVLRDDIKSYVLNQVQQAPGMLESGAKVELR